MPPSTTTVGHIAEDAAVTFLNSKGLKLIERNFRSKHGEVDLIMQDRNCTVFVEVRYRKNTDFLNPLESINQKKVNNIINCCNFYIQKSKAGVDSYRFDIITITGELKNPEIEWYENAFSQN